MNGFKLLTKFTMSVPVVVVEGATPPVGNTVLRPRDAMPRRPRNFAASAMFSPPGGVYPPNGLRGIARRSAVRVGQAEGEAVPGAIAVAMPEKIRTFAVFCC